MLRCMKRRSTCKQTEEHGERDDAFPRCLAWLGGGGGLLGWVADWTEWRRLSPLPT